MNDVVSVGSGIVASIERMVAVPQFVGKMPFAIILRQVSRFLHQYMIQPNQILNTLMKLGSVGVFGNEIFVLDASSFNSTACSNSGACRRANSTIFYTKLR